MAYRDHELDDLADQQGWDEGSRELAQFMSVAPHPYAHVEPSPQFRQALRRRLMQEAWERASKPPQPWYRRFLAPQPMAWSGAAVGAVLIVTVAFLVTLGPHQSDRVNIQVVSPQNNSQVVSTAQPIELRFSQPMKIDTVAVRVQPATAVTKQWDTQHKALTITPVNGLAGNTQYQVTVTAATTAQGQSATKIKPVTFSTGPTPAPTPSAGPTPTPAPAQSLNPRKLGPIGSARPNWSIDGASLIVVGPDGALQQVPVGTGTPQRIADGVSLSAVAPDGSPAWFAGGQVSWKTTVVNASQPIALGFRQGGLVLATASDVLTADGRRLASLKETADAAEFSPSGGELAYHGASGVHLVDLATGRDTVAGASAGLGTWAPDGRHYAYATETGVSVVDAVAGGTTRLVDLAGIQGLSWSRGNQLLLSTASALYLATYTDGSPVAPHKLADGVFGQPQWAPGGSGQFAFRRGSDLWVGKVPGAVSGGSITPVSPGLSQDELVSGFMAARKNQSTDQAMSYLDAAGKDGFTRISLVYGDPSVTLARYTVLLSQPGRAVVRLVLNRAGVQMAVDETLLIQPDASGRSFIHSVTETPRIPFMTGPEVTGVVVTGDRVQVVFDSDLDPTSAVQPGAISLKGVATQATFDSHAKTVTLTVPGGLTAGTSYDLTISASLQDVSQRHAVPYTLQVTGPAGS